MTEQRHQALKRSRLSSTTAASLADCVSCFALFCRPWGQGPGRQPTAQGLLQRLSGLSFSPCTYPVSLPSLLGLLAMRHESVELALHSLQRTCLVCAALLWPR